MIYLRTNLLRIDNTSHSAKYILHSYWVSVETFFSLKIVVMLILVNIKWYILLIYKTITTEVYSLHGS